MSDISELKNQVNTKTLNLVLLTFATGGIFPLMWLYRKYPVINEVTKHQTATDVYVIWVAVCAGISTLFNDPRYPGLVVISLLLSVAVMVLYVVWAFQAKKALEEYALSEHKIDLKMNVFYTIIFNIYYINYCINDLPEVKRKKDVISGESPQ